MNVLTESEHAADQLYRAVAAYYDIRSAVQRVDAVVATLKRKELSENGKNLVKGLEMYADAVRRANDACIGELADAQDKADELSGRKDDDNGQAA